ncbi:MAG: aconitate hydratase AcnA [Cellvibrionaceae bacterium]
MATLGKNSFDSFQQLKIDNKIYQYFSLSSVAKKYPNINNLPYSLKILLENLLRSEDGTSVTKEDILALINSGKEHPDTEIAFRPTRVLMQDFTGVPAVVDLAAMRDAVAKKGGDPSIINPLSPVDLVIDHSVMVDKFATPEAFKENVSLEMERNNERYEFLRWGQSAFNDFRVVPPGTGICHQVNLEYLAKVVWQKEIDGNILAYPDTLVGTDSHTTMINALSVLGWGVGGIEAEAAMLGQPVSMLIPEVVGFQLKGKLKEGVTATDLVLTVVEMLRAHGVVGKFVEFFGEGLNHLPLSDRATIANMAPEYGATCGFFPVDQETIDYLQLTGRDNDTVKLVETYAKAQGLWRDETVPTSYNSELALDMSKVVPSLAGPKRPQDRVALTDIKKTVNEIIELSGHNKGISIPVENKNYELSDGDVVIAAITSCTNTSNPAVMMAAGLVAKKAIEKGLTQKPWVKTSLAPGSKVVTDYLIKGGFQEYLNQLGFNLVGYGCTTCIGNSGPLPIDIDTAITKGNLTVCSVLSGNRNFEGRIHQNVRANWLASPPLVVAFALAGTTKIQFETDPVGVSSSGEKVYLKDIWPSAREISDAVALVNSDMFNKEYADVFSGDDIWKNIQTKESKTYPWNEKSTYIRNPPFFIGSNENQTTDITNARVLALLGDSITTDHISPAGSIASDSPAGKYLKDNGVEKKDFNSYGSRRGNHEVMMRGTFANIRIKNEMCKGVEGGYTKYLPTNEQLSIYDAAMAYQESGTPLVVIAGKEYGTGSSRDWAAKGTRLLGVKAVIADSYERIHRSNLIGMGVLPLQFPDGKNRRFLNLTGNEILSIEGIGQQDPNSIMTMRIQRTDGAVDTCKLVSRIDTDDEMHYFRNGGILQYVLNQLDKT